MAKLLYRIGRGAAHRAWAVIIAWLAVLALSIGAFAAFGGTLANQFEIPGTETQRLADQLQDELPEANQGVGTIVFSTDDGSEFTDGQIDRITQALDDSTEVEGVSAVTNPFHAQGELDSQREQMTDGAGQLEQLIQLRDSGQLEQAAAAGMVPPEVTPEYVDQQEAQLALGERTMELMGDYGFISSEGSTAIATVNFYAAQPDIAPEDQDGVMAAVDAAQGDGVQVDYSTELAQNLSIFGAAEVVGLIVAAIVLFIMLRTLIGAALPVLTALIGVAIAATASLSLSGAVQMASVTPVLGLMLGLAVGIDYSLFVLNRHRQQLREGVELRESIALATGTAGSAVLFAGCTVIIALVALVITGIPFLGLMGAVAAFSVFVAVLITLTLTPALLSLLGLRLLPSSQRAQVRAGHVVEEVAHVRTPRAVHHPLVALVGAAAVLILLAVPFASMRLGLPDGASEPADSTQYEAYQLVDENFGAGRNGPMTVVVEYPEGTSAEEANELQLNTGEQIAALDDVNNVVPAPLDESTNLAILQVVPESGPAEEATEVLVDDIRALSPDLEASDGATLGVAGSTAANIDISQVLADALPLYLAVVIAISLVLLVLVFRSLVVPVVASLGFLLSLMAAMGAIVAVYQWGWLGGFFGVTDPGPVLSFLPTLMVGILFGLAMDYQLFLVTGMREAYVHGHPARAAVIRGLVGGRAVVTAAAIIMASVFAGFIFSHLTMIRPMGFGLAIGVLLDAFVVRMTIIPAVMTLLGEKAWWIPRWLDRILPNVDVEGDSLQAHRPVVESPDEKSVREARETVDGEIAEALGRPGRNGTATR
ncbi:MMPL family transporter [Kocuria coralli]|uniref:MMPL family transporter n=1 Tax=Kocuria coralli TaxID=1461025 RepID=A0A5J5KZ75_9MICC|nr:MMPL family transporter [Kocuria coralli]KAA9394923.1 MMPL family transporter [Kocuria coralli]